MREVIDALVEWQNEGHQIALATVVKVYGSAPRPLGSKMAVNDAMDFVGSVSGGCVEGNVIENAMKVMDNGKSKLIRYGIADETAWGLGLACGGEIEVFVEPFHLPVSKQNDQLRIQNDIIQLHKNKKLVAVVSILTGKYRGEKLLFLPEKPTLSTLTQLKDNEIIFADVKKALSNQKSYKQQVVIEKETVEIFVDIILPQPALIIIGGVHIAMPLVQMANIMDFKTVILDSRSAFATDKRFPNADEVMVGWPAKLLQEYLINENTYVVFLSHDDKIDNPAIKIALESNARYIGALGSRKTHRKRIKSLIGMGVAAEDIEKIHAPIGLDLGAVGAEQIAIAIMAEIIAVQNGIR